VFVVIFRSTAILLAAVPTNDIAELGFTTPRPKLLEESSVNPSVLV
jgi:hypothetical protein